MNLHGWILTVLLTACATPPGEPTGEPPVEVDETTMAMEGESTPDPVPSKAPASDPFAGSPTPGAVEIEGPFGEELIDNGGFEAEAMLPWEVEEGACQVVSNGDLDGVLAEEGSRFLHGGVPTGASDCRAVQLIDLEDRGFAPGAIDAGRVKLSSEVWLANPLDEGNWDDWSRLVMHYIDEDGAEIATLRTLAGSDDQWRLRYADGLVPTGTRFIEIEAESRHRFGRENDGLFDGVSVQLDVVHRQQPGFTMKPNLQDYRTDAMTVMWETDGNLEQHSVTWGAAGGALDQESRLVTTTQVALDRFVHIAEMTGLQAGQAYEYQVVSGTTRSDLYTFYAAPEPGSDVSVAWVADTQDGPNIFQKHVDHMAARDPDLLMAPGDLIHNGWPQEDLEAYFVEVWHEQWHTPLEASSFAQTHPVLAARGNHDNEHAMAYAYTALPENEAWYAFTFGNVFFVVLDTQGPIDDPSRAELSQLQYAKDALSSAEAQAAEWRVVTYHSPPYTNTRHDDWTTGWNGAQKYWLETFEQYDVDMVVCGHMHSYQQGETNGIRYVIVGGGGAQVDDEVMDLYSFLDVIELKWHYAMFETHGDQLVWTAYDKNDNVIDTFELRH